MHEKGRFGIITKKCEYMIETNCYYRESNYYRVWIEASGEGYIRILKRVKFKMLVRLLSGILVEMKSAPGKRPRITIYISRHLIDDMSENTLEFIDFCRVSREIDLELIALE